MKTTTNRNGKGGHPGGKKHVPNSQVFNVQPPVVESLEPFPGIEVQVRLLKGTNLGFRRVNSDKGLNFGQVGTDPRKDPVELFVRVNDNSPVLGSLKDSGSETPGKIVIFTKSQNGEVKIQAESHRKNRSIYRSTVQISRSGDGRVSVNSSTNNLYIALMTSQQIIIKAVALVYQDNRFWVLAQTAYSSLLYRNQETGSVEYPVLHLKHGGLISLAESPVVADYLKSITDEERSMLPSVEEYQKELISFDGLKSDELVIKLWSLRKGVGVGITADGTEVNIYYEDLNQGWPRAVKTGDICRFKFLRPIPEREAKHRKTRLHFDAQGVKPL